MHAARSLRTLALSLLAILVVASAGPRAQQPLTQSAFDRGWQSGTPAAIAGELIAIVADDFQRGRSELMHYVRDSRTGRTFRIRYRTTPPSILSGGVISLSGRTSGSDFYVEATTTDPTVTQSSGGSTASAPTGGASGDHGVVVLVANFRDAECNCSVDLVRQAMFTNPNGVTVDALYRESSHGAMSVSGDVFGTFTIDASVNDTCDLTGWAEKADTLAIARGVDLTRYQHRMYVMPRNSCPASGFGTVGGSPGYSWVFAWDIQGVYAHELGHNLGMDHATTPTSEYGDWTDPMAMSTWQMRGVNAPHRDQLGWLPAGSRQRLTDSGTYALAPLQLDPALATAPQALTFYKPDTGDMYYVSYRVAQGFDQYISGAYLDRLSIHTASADGSSTKTKLVTGLSDGESFTDALTGVTVTMVGHSSSVATVRVTFASTCVPAPMSVNTSPALQSAPGGTTLRYDVTITNQDGPGCGASTLQLSGSVVSGWTVEAQPSSVTISPGGTAAASIAVTSPSASSLRSYYVWVSAADAQRSVHDASAYATYAVVSGCARNAPALSAAAPDQSGAAGSRLTYTLTLLNRDSPDCPATTFAMQTSVPTGWSADVSTPSVALGPGAAATVSASIASASGAAPDTYATPVAAVDPTSDGHSAATTLRYTVTAAPSVPPAAPSSLTATVKQKQKQIQLAWTENGAVAGFRILRNGSVVGVSNLTSWTDIAWRSGETYSYSVVAFDFSGLESAPSNTATVTLPGSKRK